MNMLQLKQYADEEFALIHFNEVSHKKEPMGKYHDLAVFDDTRNPIRVVFNHMYLCRMERKNNLYKAYPLQEIIPEKILSDHLPEISDYIFRTNYELIESTLTEKAYRKASEEVEKKFVQEISELKAKIRSLEKQAITPQTKMDSETDKEIHHGILSEEYLSDGFYSAHYNSSHSKLMVSKDEHGTLSCQNHSINIENLLKPFENRKLTISKCPYLNGVLIEAHVC